MKFCDILKELRSAHYMTQKDLAQKLKYSQSVICEWEKGTTQPTAQAIITLAKFFNVTTDYLLGCEPDIQSELAEQPEDELILLHAYRQMSEGKKRGLFQMLDLDAEAINRKKA